MAPLNSFNVTVGDVTTQTGITNSNENDGDQAAKISVGIVCAAVCVVVFVILVCIRKRMHQPHRSSRGTAADDSDSDVNDDDGAEFDEHNMIELMRQKSTTSTASLELPIWNSVSKALKKTVKQHMIEYKCLSMGAVIGKGQFGMVHEALMTDDEQQTNDYGQVSMRKAPIKTLRGMNTYGRINTLQRTASRTRTPLKAMSNYFGSFLFSAFLLLNVNVD